MSTTSSAWSLGYSDGQRKQPTWRKILKSEYLAEYDEGFYAGQVSRLQQPDQQSHVRMRRRTSNR